MQIYRKRTRKKPVQETEVSVIKIVFFFQKKLRIYLYSSVYCFRLISLQFTIYRAFFYFLFSDMNKIRFSNKKLNSNIYSNPIL